jgi:hypothetical protein
MAVEQILQKEINKSKRSLDLETEESTYKRDLQKRIELLSWTLQNMKYSDIYICEFIETKMYEIIDIINQTDSVLEGDPQHSKLRILDWILYQVCINGKINFPG